FAVQRVRPPAIRARSRQGRAGGAQGHRSRQGRADAGEKAQRRKGLCAAAYEGHEREQEDRRDRPVGAHGGGASQMTEKLRIGFIPLVDATVLLVAVDQGFTAAEGLSIELVREVSWSNVRDKLNIGLFDAAHLLSAVAI